MRQNKIFTWALAAISLAAVAACSEYEDSVTPSPTSNAEGVAFDAVNVAVDLQSDDNTVPIRIHRMGTAPLTSTLTVDSVTYLADGVTPFCTVPQSVTFAAGEKAVTVLGTLNSECEMNVKYSLSLKIAETVDNPYSAGSHYATFDVFVHYTWEPAGRVFFESDWAQTGDTVHVERAKELPTLYRLMSPYHVLEPNFCPEPGYHIQFLLDENYNAVSLPMYQNIGELGYDPLSLEEYGWWYLYWSVDEWYCSFDNYENYYIIQGGMVAGGDDLEFIDGMGAYETFEWVDGFPWDEEE